MHFQFSTHISFLTAHVFVYVYTPSLRPCNNTYSVPSFHTCSVHVLTTRPPRILITHRLSSLLTALLHCSPTHLHYSPCALDYSQRMLSHNPFSFRFCKSIITTSTKASPRWLYGTQSVQYFMALNFYSRVAMHMSK